MFNLEMLMRANAAQAKAETRELAGEVRTATTAAGALDVQGRQTAAGVNQMAAAERAAVASTLQLNKANRLAAGSAANLFAQGNDVITMIVAGQAPMQTALQQGTQITQVLGPLGAQGALKALGTTALTLISPLNLITIGSIAAGSALIQWLRKGEEEAISLEDRLGDIDEMLNAVRETSERLADLKLGSLSDEFGVVTAEIREMIEAQRDVELRLGALQLPGINEDVLDGLEETFGTFTRLDQAGRNLEATIGIVMREFSLTRNEVEALGQAVLAVETAQGPQQMADAYRALYSWIEYAVIGTRDLSEEEEDFLISLLDAESAARRFAAIEMSGGVKAASDYAADLVAQLGMSVELANTLASLGPQGLLPNEGNPGAGAGRGADPRDFGGSLDDWRNRDAIVYLENWKPPRKSRGGRGSEADEVAQLLDSLRLELDLLREIDPVQKELIQNREVLAKATDAERAAVERLIAERLAEEQAIESTQQKRDLLADTGYSVFEDIRRDGLSAVDVVERLGDAFEEAFFKALLLGEGPLTGLLGTGSDSGGILGMLGAALFPVPGHAEGGMIYGRGSSTSDDIFMVTPSGSPVRASNGEFMVNARATARNRHLLELINAGFDIPGFAGGGSVSGAAAAPDPRPGRPAGSSARSGAGRGDVHHWHIQTQDAGSFMQSRAGVARKGRALIAASRRVS